ncbi:MAG TPA: hypothetical protein VG457_10440 [Planctomycetota bacterium]|nr:hypothetical protein [Planctomycetota bacterium]
MKKLLWVVPALLIPGSAWAQENIFSTNTSSGTVSVTDGQTFVPLPATASFGPNPINMGANSSPSSIIYDPIRTRVYVVNTSAGTVVAIDPTNFTTTSISPATLASGLSMAAMSQDGRWLFAAGLDSNSGMYGIFQFDLDNFSSAGASFLGGFPPAASTTYAFADVEVLPGSAVGGAGNGPGKVYFTYTANFSGTLAIVTYHIGEIDVQSGVFTDIYATNAANNAVPHVFTRMTRSPDNSFILVGTTAGSAVSPLAWQVPRINPLAVPVVDLVTIPSTAATEVAEDFVFTTSGSAPFTVCMLARNDISEAPRFFSITATGLAGAETDGPVVPAGFGGAMTPDLAHNRIFFAWNGSGAFPNSFEILSPPTPAGAFRVTNPPNSGGPGPQQVVVAPAPAPLALDFSTEPAGVTTGGSFVLDMVGGGFIQGSSRGRLVDPTGVNIFATSTQVLSSGELLATFPSQGSATHYDVSVVNNDGQVKLISGFFQGLVANAATSGLPLTIPDLKNGYRMLSFPEFATVADLRSALTGQLGPYNPVLYRVFLWQQGQYVEINSPGLFPSTSLMGTGVFAITRNGGALTLTATDVTKNSTNNQRVVALNSGWNIVSQPWINGPTNTIAYGNLDVHLQSDLLDAAVPATTSPAVTNILYEASGGVYVTSNVMTAGRGYWILNMTAAPVYLVFRLAVVNLKPEIGFQTRSSANTATPPAMPGGMSDSGGGGGGCGLLGPEILLVALFLRGRGRRRLTA